MKVSILCRLPNQGERLKHPFVRAKPAGIPTASPMSAKLYIFYITQSCWNFTHKRNVCASEMTISKRCDMPVWLLLAECSESISHNHTAHIKKCPDSIVGKRQRPQAFLIYSYVISTAIGTWHSVLQSQHISPFLQLTI